MCQGDAFLVQGSWRKARLLRDQSGLRFLKNPQDFPADQGRQVRSTFAENEEGPPCQEGLLCLHWVQSAKKHYILDICGAGGIRTLTEFPPADLSYQG